jgi:phage shock protein C
MIAGVCAGLADYLGWSRGLLRLGFLIFAIVGVGELVYVILWILMPKESR